MSDTICAISTPHGVGGIAVVRISGEKALEISDKVWRGKRLSEVCSHTAHLGTVIDLCCTDDCKELDQAVATVFRSPKSFTGENVVEFAVHGSTYVQNQLLMSLIQAGARLAEAGEFTRRAFTSGKMDLAQAEAVADVIGAQSKAALKIANNQMRGHFSQRLRQLRDQLLQLTSLLELELDFSEEDVEFASRKQLLDLACEVKREVDSLASSFHAGNAIKNGIPVAIVGATNAGKSSLLNALIGDERAIVSDIHGTTRDVVEDTLHIGDYAFRIMDTAGLRHTTDKIEAIGIERSLNAASKADIVLAVVDANDPKPIEIPTTTAQIIILLNKSDVSDRQNVEMSEYVMVEGSKAQPYATLSLSAKTGAGLQELKNAMEKLASTTDTNSNIITNARHYQALIEASASIGRAIEGIQSSLSGDLISLDIRHTIHALSSILGTISDQDILSNIFSRFCIGK